MKTMNLTAAAAALLIFPVMLCSCGTCNETDKTDKGEYTGVPVPQQEVKAVEVQPGIQAEKTDFSVTPAAAEPKNEPAPEVKKAEPASESASKQEEEKIELPCKHQVRTGDNLWKLSRKYYGRGSEWKRIYEANKAEIKKPEFLEPGTVLTIPAAK